MIHRGDQLQGRYWNTHISNVHNRLYHWYRFPFNHIIIMIDYLKIGNQSWNCLKLKQRNMKASRQSCQILHLVSLISWNRRWLNMISQSRGRNLNGVHSIDQPRNTKHHQNINQHLRINLQLILDMPLIINHTSWTLIRKYHYWKCGRNHVNRAIWIRETHLS